MLQWKTGICLASHEAAMDFLGLLAELTATVAYRFSQLLCMHDGVRAVEKINYPVSRPSSGNLRAILSRKILKLVQLRRTWMYQCRERQDAGSDFLRFSSIESPKSDPQGCGKCWFRQEHEPAYPNMNAIFGQFIFTATLNWMEIDIPHLCRRKPLFLNRKVQVGTTGTLQAFRTRRTCTPASALCSQGSY